ncbi:MAG TPA: chemotaxis protein CheA [Bryobacteraceae bacterium]|jgi:two-component system chemotaxis sensor kinase CheA
MSMMHDRENAPGGPVQAVCDAVDELATRAMLGEASEGGAGNVIPALIALAREARGVKLEKIATNAEELALRLAGPDGRNSTVLLDGIARLQETTQASVQAAETERDKTPAQEAPADAVAQSPAPVEAAGWAADPELLGEFFMESGDHLNSIEAMLLTLEQDAQNKDAINAVFRSFHTIKGLAGFLAFPNIQEVAHEVETLLDCARQEKLTITPEVIDVVLASADHLKRELDRLQRIAAGSAAEDAQDHRPLLDQVRAQMNPGDGRQKAEVKSPETEAKKAEPEARTETTKKNVAVESRMVKVDTSKLDFLVDMAGELVIAQSLIEHDGQLNAANNPRLQRNLSQLARITAEVQRTSMAMRMVQVSQLFQKSARLVRDLSRKSGKQVELEVSGEDTELDRTIVEDLSDPLMHMIRNSMDHGIETPEQRAAAGKTPLAKVSLKAYHQAGFIIVEVSDDGRGLDRQKILKKAVERGLVQEGAALTDKEVFNLIFEPGFSTAEKITDVSGRGVGMDVVRKSIQKMRGRIDIESRPGEGSTFFLKLPLTLAIIDGLVVKVGEERYIVPIFAVRELFRPAEDARYTVEGRDEMILVRGNLLPVTRLSSCFRIEARAAQVSEGVLVVVETTTKSFCLFVDEVIGKQEVVIKNLGGTFKRLPGISGGAILGDGRVGLILDVDTILSGIEGNLEHV